MFNKLLRKLRRKKGNRAQMECASNARFSGNIDRDEKLLRETFQDCGDVKYKRLSIPALNKRPATVVFVEGLVNVETLQRDILAQLLASKPPAKDITELISVGELSSYVCIQEVDSKILLGKVAILVQGEAKIYIINLMDWPKRGIDEPIQERLIRGPREGFIEVLHVNLGLIRRRLPDRNLKIITMEVGRRSKTQVAIMYVEDVCDLNVVEEIEERIMAIDIDGILDPGALTELIAERTISPFPTFLSTERPDKVVGCLLQGKIAIASDGSPFAMLAPISFSDFLQVPEDYYVHPLFATLSRLLRFTGVCMATTLVAAFVGVLTFHYDMIPREIISFIAKTREGVPFSPLTEALLLEFTVEILREASIRLPGPIGPTLGIVGALILGQAAVAAHLVSPVMLIVVAVSFIGGSIVPNYEASLIVRWLRFPIILAGGVL